MGDRQRKRQPERVEVPVPVGLGDAVLMLVHVENEIMLGVRPTIEGHEALIRKRNMLLEVLNRVPLDDLYFDCNGDGVPDSERPNDIFEAAASTACCRIVKKKGGLGRTSKKSSSRRKGG